MRKPKKKELINELRKGEKSGFVPNFKRKSFLNRLHQKYLPYHQIPNQQSCYN